jgi:peptidoglycan hydrolase-like protein with peptidoglycan-binding domain
VAPPNPSRDALGPTLRYGDSGPEVRELQDRLRQLWLYSGPSDGEYGRKVRHAVEVYQSYKDIDGDEEGVYGSNTRRALEAETSG